MVSVVSPGVRQAISLRLPPALHAELVQKAKEQGVSLNTLLISLLAGSIGFTLKPRDP